MFLFSKFVFQFMYISKYLNWEVVYKNISEWNNDFNLQYMYMNMFQVCCPFYSSTQVANGNTQNYRQWRDCQVVMVTSQNSCLCKENSNHLHHRNQGRSKLKYMYHGVLYYSEAWTINYILLLEQLSVLHCYYS